MKKLGFMFFNVFVLAGMPTILIWAVGIVTVRIQLEWFCAKNNIAIDQAIIANSAMQINNYFFVLRTIPMVAYCIFLSVWVLRMLPKFIAYLQSLTD